MQVHRAMRLMAMQVNSNAGNGNVSCYQCIQNNLPPSCSKKSVRQPINGGIKKYHESPLNNLKSRLIKNYLRQRCQADKYCNRAELKNQAPTVNNDTVEDGVGNLDLIDNLQ